MTTATRNDAQPIYLIVATALSPNLGIGNRGDLPWPQIRTDMAFFRKVTSNNTSANVTSRNAVIMGRKTWDSIPEKFRPLGGRINVVLTRGDESACQGLAERIKAELERKATTSTTAAKVSSNAQSQGWTLTTRSLSATASSDNQAQARVLVSLGQERNNQIFSDVILTNSLDEATNIENYTVNTTQDTHHDDVRKSQLNELFCIGGAQVYNMILRDKELRPRVRVLQTQVRKVDGQEFECDTFWPEELKDGVNGWRRADDEEVRKWIGTDLPQAQNEWVEDEKAGVELKVVGWTRA